MEIKGRKLKMLIELHQSLEQMQQEKPLEYRNVLKKMAQCFRSNQKNYPLAFVLQELVYSINDTEARQEFDQLPEAVKRTLSQARRIINWQTGIKHLKEWYDSLKQDREELIPFDYMAKLEELAQKYREKENWYRLAIVLDEMVQTEKSMKNPNEAAQLELSALVINRREILDVAQEVMGRNLQVIEIKEEEVRA